MALTCRAIDNGQHPYGDVRSLYAWAESLVFEARRIPLPQRDALRFQALAHRHPGPDLITSALRTAAGNALAALQARKGLPKGGAYGLETAARRAEFGVFDEERVSVDNCRILLWTPAAQLWCTVIEDYRWTRDLSAWCVLAALLATLVPEPVSASYDPAHPPFYTRALDSFADAVITKARLSRDGQGWYASLDTGPDTRVSDPDFCRYAKTREAAIALCAAAIRADAQGIGRYAPHSCLVDGYDLHFRLMKHWAAKESALAA